MDYANEIIKNPAEGRAKLLTDSNSFCPMRPITSPMSIGLISKTSSGIAAVILSFEPRPFLATKKPIFLRNSSGLRGLTRQPTAIYRYGIAVDIISGAGCQENHWAH